ncbi:MAG TPA: hypothetical protein VEO01_08110 [Pseudonocardiaceae bacterium]|nr:hypothetical protein [Pseudonocardiaceae bacterium]
MPAYFPIVNSKIPPQKIPSVEDMGKYLALLSVGAFALAYLFQDEFYGDFELTPEAVGIDRVDSILHLIPTIFLVFCILVAGYSLLSVLGAALLRFAHRFGLLRKVLQSADKIEPWALFLVPPSIALLGFFLISVPSVFMNSSPPLAVGILTILSLTISLYIALTATLGKWGKLLFGAAMVAFLAMAAAGAIDDSVNHLRITGRSSFVLTSIGIPVHYATVRWIVPSHKPDSIEDTPSDFLTKDERHILVIIAETSTSYTIFDCHTNTAHIVNADEVVVDPGYSLPGHLPRGVDSNQWLQAGLDCPN